jgi:starvation-inducible outer membrane lipoprotein
LKKTVTSTILIIVLGLIVLAGCSRLGKYGDPISEQPTTNIDSIVANSTSYEGKTVKVEGKILDECPSGCWFNLKGEKAVMYVTLSGFVIPQKVGRPTIVEGDLTNESGRLTIQAKGIEIR